MLKKGMGLLLCSALIMVSCNNQSNKQNETSAEHTTDKQISEVQEENADEKNLPPKPEKYSWFFQICTYTGTFDANKYTKEQLDNTLEYLINGKGTSRPYSIFRPDDLKRVDKNDVEKEFNETLKNLKTLEFINTPQFNELKQKRIEEIERVKLLSLIEIESYSNPEVLKNDNYSKKGCSKYVNALVAGGDELLTMRKKMAEESRDKGNSSAWDRYIKETKSSNELLLAKVYVTTFGWWNCVNESIERTDPYEIHKTGFMGLFEDVTEDCEMP